MKTNRPRPPEDLDGEALLEWQRIVEELDQLGTLDTTDRALLTLYCQTWATNQKAYQHVAKYGSVVKWPSGPGQTPWYKTVRETGTQLAKLLDQLGLTPANRKTTADDQATDITF